MTAVKNMSKREVLKKLKKESVVKLAEEHGIEVKKKKKEDLIGDILTAQAPKSILTPVISQTSGLQAYVPQTDRGNLPPFNKVVYSERIRPPKITFGHIYSFMVLRPTVSGGQVNNFKGLDRAVKHFEAGDVQDIGCAEIDSSIVYVKATCQASMKKTKYQVYVCVSKSDDPAIQYGYCQCPIGLAQACSHIGSLLFALSNAKPDQGPDDNDSLSCTSKLCQWKIPRSNVKPQPMSTLNPRKALQQFPGQIDTESTLENFDPRHTSDREIDVNLEELRTLKDIFPNTGLSHLWNIPDRVPSVYEEVEVQTVVHPLFVKMQDMIFSKQNVPPVTIDKDLVQYIENYTKGQRLSEMWKDLHIGRLTSSIFGAVLSSGDNPRSLVKQILEGSSLNNKSESTNFDGTITKLQQRYKTLPAAVKWGIDNESIARSEYIALKQICCEHFQVEETGLTLCETHSFIGASSDGRVTEDGNVGVLEIKCPYSVQGQLINNMEVLEIVAMNYKEFCLESSQEGIRLKKTHKYYAQVQGEMAVMSLPWCDFVIWTAAPQNNLFVDRVYFDPEFVTDMLPKLVEFYISHVFPALDCNTQH